MKLTRERLPETCLTRTVSAAFGKPCLSVPPIGGSSTSRDNSVDSGADAAASGTAITAVSPTPKREAGIDWLHLAEGSLAFLAIEHAFRYATEYGTRDAFNTPFWPGYLNSVGNLH